MVPLFPPCRPAVDHQRAHAADAFAAIVIERDGLLTLVAQLLVEDVEHLEERGVGRNLLDLVRDEIAGHVALGLAPDVELEIDIAHL